MPYRGNNFSFVINSSFQPFTMQEMLVPFSAYKDAYEKMEESYVDLSDKADKFKYLSDTLPEGSKARSIYEGYANDLKAQADDLARNGLGMGNRRALMNLKRRYSGEIGKLNQIDEIRRAQIKEQNALRLQDPTRMFSRRADMTSFDDYLDNPDLGYESYSGAMLAQQVGTAASAIAKGLRDYSNGKPLDGYTKTWLQQHGYSADEVAAAIQNPAYDTSGVLSSIVEQAVQSSGIPKWADASTINQAYQYARQGLWNAVGQTNVATYTDEAAKLAAQEESQKRLAKYNSDLEVDRYIKMQQGQQKNSLAINPLNIYSQKELDDIGKNMRNYAKYFDIDSHGRTKLNKEGIKEYYANANPGVKVAGSGSGTARLMNAETQLQNGDKEFIPTGFRKFIDDIGGADYVSKKQFGLLGNLWNQYNREHSSSKYDATKSTEFDFSLDSTQQAGMKNAILTALGGADLEEVDFDRKDNVFKPSGGKLSAEDLNKDDYTVVSTRFSPYGNSAIIKDASGKSHRYKLPVNINPTNEEARDISMNNALKIQKAVVEYRQKGYYTDNNGNPIVPTQEQLAALYDKYKEELQKAYLYHSQIGLLQNKTKEQEFNPYGF